MCENVHSTVTLIRPKPPCAMKIFTTLCAYIRDKSSLMESTREAFVIYFHSSVGGGGGGE